MATADTADRAVSVANAFADALVSVLNAGEAARVDEAADTAATAERSLRDQLATLRAELDAAEGDEADDIQAEIDDIANRLGTTAVAPSSPSTVYASFETADEATSVDRVVPGGTRTQRMLLASVVALMLAAGVSITVDRADGRIVTAQHAERRFRLPVAAEVPLLPVRDRHRAAVFAYHRHQGMAAAYRRLRDGLGRPEPEFRDDDVRTWSGNLDDMPAGRRVVVVTSAEHRDGKSTTAANLAIAFAEAGEKTLLLQWDLVRPLPARVLGADDGSGLAEVLRGEGTLDSFLQETSEARLSFVPAGSVGDLPDKASPQVATALDATRRLADVVIVDTAPVLSSEVTKQLVTLADVVLVSCSAGGTSAPAAERCADLLEQLDAPAVGVVLVGVPSGRGAGARARSAAVVPVPSEPVAS
jgi:capsular exopolysaccharide synthesis family protein